MKYKILISIIVTILIYGCDKEKNGWTIDNLSLSKVNYTGTEIRLDGYYYQHNNNYTDIIFFYRNGAALFPGGVESSEKGMDDYISREFLNNFAYKEDQLSWGLFNIDGNVIKFENWFPTGWIGKKVYMSSGNILNDTTFVITTFKYSYGSDLESRNDIYHFRKFHPKPDSINNIIK